MLGTGPGFVCPAGFWREERFADSGGMLRDLGHPCDVLGIGNALVIWGAGGGASEVQTVACRILLDPLSVDQNPSRLSGVPREELWS